MSRLPTPQAHSWALGQKLSWRFQTLSRLLVTGQKDSQKPFPKAQEGVVGKKYQLLEEIAKGSQYLEAWGPHTRGSEHSLSHLLVARVWVDYLMSVSFSFLIGIITSHPLMRELDDACKALSSWPGTS